MREWIRFSWLKIQSVAVPYKNKEMVRFISGERNFFASWADVGYSRKSTESVIVGITNNK
jgi:hypothetical protein